MKKARRERKRNIDKENKCVREMKGVEIEEEREHFRVKLTQRVSQKLLILISIAICQLLF